jgi:hypothetical protein
MACHHDFIAGSKERMANEFKDLVRSVPKNNVQTVNAEPFSDRVAEFIEALSRAGARVEWHALGRVVTVRYEGAIGSVSFLPFPHFDYASVESLQRLAPFFASVAENLGEILTCSSWHGDLPKFVTEKRQLRVFLPSGVKNRRAAATAVYTYLQSGTGYGSEDRARAALPLIEKALAEARSRDVPKKYRPQVEELFRSAFANDDLATYEHARHLAELVSESSPTARKNPPPTYIPASARKERAEADAATLEHHKAFLSRVRALKEKYGSSWQFPELAGLTPVPYEYVPTSLGEHLLADYAQAVGQEGVSVASPQGMGRVEYGLGFPDGSSAVVTQDPRAPLGALAVTRFAGNPRVVGAVLARAAEHMGNLVSVEDVSLAKAMSAIKHKRVGVPSLYVPAPIKNKREVADAYFALRVDAQDADALYTFAKAVREALFPRVPKEYRPKFARFVSQAFGDDALGFLNVTGAGTSSPDQVGAYRQARDLAELVSE